MTVRYGIVDDPASFAAMRDEWNQLLRRAPLAATPFLTWEWMHAWWSHYAQSDPANRLQIVVARNSSGELVGLLPAYRRTVTRFGLRHRCVSLIGGQFESSDYLAVVLDDPKRADVAEGLLEALTAFSRADVLEFPNLLERDGTEDIVRSFAAGRRFVFRVRRHRVCPYIALRGTWDEYLGALGPNMRYNIRRRSRALLDAPDVECGLVRTQQELDQLLPMLFDLHARRSASINRQSIFRGDARLSFHRTVSRLFLEQDRLRFFFLKAGGSPIALLYCFEHGGELFYFQAGMDPAWEKKSVGLVLMAQAIRRAFEAGLTRFDFMRGGEDYKFKWTSTVRYMSVCRVGVSPLGKCLVALEDDARRAKEWLKGAAPSVAGTLRLPASWVHQNAR